MGLAAHSYQSLKGGRFPRPPAVDYLNQFRDLIIQEENTSERERAERDSNYFCEKFTNWPREEFHKKWIKFLHRQQVSLLLAPREHAKTMQITINETSQKVLKDRNFRVLIVCDTETMSVRMGRAIKSILTSEKVREVWGDVKGPKWSDKEFTLAGSTLGEKEASVTCLSVGGAVTSGHYDLVILDDTVDYENSRSQLQRDKLWEWFRMTLLPVAARGMLWIIGTRYHWDDLYGRLQDRLQWPRGIAMLREKALSDDCMALWPDMYPAEVLEGLRKDLGTLIFNAQYQNDAEAMKGSIFKFEWLKRYQKLPTGLKYYQGYDLAISEKDTADFFSGVTLGVDQKGNVYVVGEYKDRLSFEQQFNKIVDLYNYYDKPSHPVMRVGIEVNQYQDALAKHVIANTRVPVKRIHRHKDKVTMALRVQPHFENGKVFLPMEGCEELENQLLTFSPDGIPFDDVFDGFINAMEVAGKGGKRKPHRTRKPGGF